MLFGKIKALVEYGVRTGLIEAEDMIYTRNRLLRRFVKRITRMRKRSRAKTWHFCWTAFATKP